MEKRDIMTATERHEHYLPLARIMLVDAGARIEEVEEFDLEEKVANCLDLMEWEAHDHTIDMECDEMIDAKYMLANIYSDKLMAIAYKNPEWDKKSDIGIVWQYNDEMVLIGLPDFYNCPNCKNKAICHRCEMYGRILILRGDDLEPEDWGMHKEDCKIAEAVGVFQKVPEHWELMYKEALDK